MPPSPASCTRPTASPSTARPCANHQKNPPSVASLTPTTPSEPLKPSMGAAVRDHRNAVRDRSESLSAINRNTCPQSPESALYADRTSTATMRANQMRLWFASMAYVLLCALRRIGLHDTEYAKATCGTIRLKLLKIGALVRISVRRIKVAMASGCPAAAAWGLAAVHLAASANPRASPA